MRTEDAAAQEGGLAAASLEPIKSRSRTDSHADAVPVVSRIISVFGRRSSVHPSGPPFWAKNGTDGSPRTTTDTLSASGLRSIGHIA